MAATVEAAQLTERHRLAQARLAAAVIFQSVAAWQVLDPARLDETTPDWLRLMVPLVAAHRRSSAVLAGRYLEQFRAHELGFETPPFPVILGDAVDTTAVTTSLVVTGPVRIKSSMTAGLQLTRAVDTAQAASAQAAMRHVLDGGRSTVTATTHADRRALGWARVVSGRPCSFCAMLAGRGPVYKAETARFDAHDHCSCASEPVYRSDAAWPPGSRRYADLYDEVAKGLPPDEARLAFRHAFEAEPAAA